MNAMGWDPKKRKSRIKKLKTDVPRFVRRLAEELEDEYGPNLEGEIKAYEEIVAWLQTLAYDNEVYRRSLCEQLRRKQAKTRGRGE